MEQHNYHNEFQLVKKLKTGDLNAFNQLFNVYSSRLYHFAYGYFKSKDEAEELVQETFCKVWERKNDLKEEFQFRSYLFAIAFNYIRKYFRSKALMNKYMESTAAGSGQIVLTSPDVNYPSLRALVDRLVVEMPETRRAVFVKSRY